MSQLSKKIIQWQRKFGRNNLPWQINVTPYKVWISEIMLQQTQVKTVIPYFEKFMTRFPNIDSLADSTEDEVLSYWSGLGYYSRGRNILRSAKIIREKFNSSMPSDLDSLESLPGIGKSTAGAIRSLGFKKNAAILDGNAKRVLIRYFKVEEAVNSTKTLKKLWQIAEEQSPIKDCDVYTQAIMDVGSLLCKRTNPLCDQCPLEHDCQAKQDGIEGLLPKKLPKKNKQRRYVYWAFIKNDKGEVLLENRTSKGVWEGLWSFPEFQKKIERQDFLKRFKPICKLTDKETTLKHSFSHYDIDINIITLKVISTKIKENDKAWFNSKDIIKIGIPAPVNKILKK